jgi:signal transduction histidine kinase
MRAASGSELWLLRLMAERGLRVLGASGLMIAMTGDRELEIVAEAGAVMPRVRSLPVGSSALGRLSQEGTRIALDRPSAREAPWLTELGVQAAAVLVEPLPVEGQPGLMIALRSRDPGFETGEVLAAADLARSIVERLEAERSVERERLRHGVLARERERTRWARELHDETIQGLGALRMLLEYAHCVSDPQEREEALESALGEVDREIESLRHLITELRPAALDDLGLVAALQAIARRAGAVDGLTVQSELPREQAVPRLGPDIESAVYRIVQEALTNAAKHSGASHVAVSLRIAGDRLVASVRDDGSGFTPDAEAPNAPRAGSPEPLSGFGLRGMRERAELVGAELEVGSQPGVGTTVRVSVPIAGSDGSGSGTGER